jgi:hypothetical protein
VTDVTCIQWISNSYKYLVQKLHGGESKHIYKIFIYFVNGLNAVVAVIHLTLTIQLSCAAGINMAAVLITGTKKGSVQ